jgi:hypothetical protein
MTMYFSGTKIRNLLVTVYQVSITEVVNHFSDRDARPVCSHTTDLEHKQMEGDEVNLTFNPSFQVSQHRAGRKAVVWRQLGYIHGRLSTD